MTEVFFFRNKNSCKLTSQSVPPSSSDDRLVLDRFAPRGEEAVLSTSLSSKLYSVRDTEHNQSRFNQDLLQLIFQRCFFTQIIQHWRKITRNSGVIYNHSCVKIEHPVALNMQAPCWTDLCTSYIYLFCSLIFILIIRLVFLIRWVIFLKRNVHKLRRLQQNRRKVTTFYWQDKALHSNGTLSGQIYATAEEIKWSSQRKETTERGRRNQIY